MNTDVRRSIFVTLLSSADYQDAHDKLLKLRLNKYDKREVPNVLLQCVGSEEIYNPYYALVAAKVCSDRKVQWAFQNCLWKIFRRIGESIFGEDDDDYEYDDTMDAQRLSNIARMYGTLVANGTLELDILKCLNLAYLQPKTQAIVEVMLLTMLQELSTRDKSKGKKGRREMVQKPFKAITSEELTKGLKFFTSKLRRSDLAKKRESRRVLEALNLAEEALDEAMTKDSLIL